LLAVTGASCGAWQRSGARSCDKLGSDKYKLRPMAPLGGVERPRRKVRFARLIHRRGRDLGGPLVRAADGGNLSGRWPPRRVMLPV
jgi:hypothetical protein